MTDKLAAVIVTQDDPFYLGENIDYLISALGANASISACVLLDVSPFGKKVSLFSQAWDVLKTFGPRFFFRYAIVFAASKFQAKKQIRKVLAKHGIPLVTLTHNINHPDSLGRIRAFEPDLIISIAASQIFKKDLIALPKNGCINLHTALLPKYRGIMPSFWVLRNQESHTGVSVFLMDEGIDSGPILVQKPVEIGSRSLEQLIQYTKRLGMDAVVAAVSKIRQGDLSLLPNDARQMTYFSRPTRADVREFYRAGKRFF